MLAKAKMPSLGLSVNFRERLSLTMTREMNDELLLVMLFFGFLFLFTSLTGADASNALPSPNAGAEPRTDPVASPKEDVPRPSSLPRPPSVEERTSLSLSPMLPFTEKLVLNIAAAGRERVFILMRETCVPAVAGCGFVARGFGLTIGASEGCGGGVAR